MEKNMTFEENFNKLQEISKKIESNTLALDEIMSLYEQGIALAKILQGDLDKAKEKFANLSEMNDKIENSK